MVDPKTGMVDQAYTAVTPDAYRAYLAEYPGTLRSHGPVDELGLDSAWEDTAGGPWPEGLVAFISRGSKTCYVRTP